MHRSFVGSSRLRRELHRLRMTTGWVVFCGSLLLAAHALFEFAGPVAGDGQVRAFGIF
jgi:hypothetical protein